MNNFTLTLAIVLAADLCATRVPARDAAPAERNAVNTAARPGGMMADSPVTFPKEGALPAKYNRRKGRLNAVWGDNFHATLVDSGSYLWRCLSYAELNMVRCGVVSHPPQWEWVGYHEIMGRRQRYRLLDLDRLCWRLGTTSLGEVRENLESVLQEKIERDRLKREPCWTESLAVGSPAFVGRIQPLILSRRETEIVEEEPGLWVLKEAEVSYGSKSSSRIGSKA